jgi:hypothetical protein
MIWPLLARYVVAMAEGEAVAEGATVRAIGVGIALALVVGRDVWALWRRMCA